MIHDDDVRDLIDTAGYAISYWCSAAVTSDDDAEAYTVTEVDTGQRFVLGLEALRAAWDRVLSGTMDVRPSIVQSLRDNDVDTDAADVVVQVACFGTIIYS